MQPRIKKIKHHIIFKRAIGIVLMCTFLLGNTPKQLLHSLSANHTDQPVKKLSDQFQYSKAGFNCDCNSIVATSPFTETSAQIAIEKLLPFSLYQVSITASVYNTDHFYSNLRGPPAIV